MHLWVSWMGPRAFYGPVALDLIALFLGLLSSWDLTPVGLLPWFPFLVPTVSVASLRFHAWGSLSCLDCQKTFSCETRGTRLRNPLTLIAWIYNRNSCYCDFKHSVLVFNRKNKKDADSLQEVSKIIWLRSFKKRSFRYLVQHLNFFEKYSHVSNSTEFSTKETYKFLLSVRFYSD